MNGIEKLSLNGTENSTRVALSLQIKDTVALKYKIYFPSTLEYWTRPIS